MKICLDAGHYGKYNPGVVKGYYEAEMNWKLHNLLKKYLEEYGVEVTQTRSDQKKDLGLTARGQKANGCDLFLSIHSNGCDKESVDYPVVYVPINGSGTKLGDKLAKCIETTMGTKQKGRAATRKSDNGNWDYYSVIYGAVSVGVPGLILEHSFHTNNKACKWLMDDSNLDKMAKAEADVIAEHYCLQKKDEEKKVIYRVQVGAFSVKKYAEAYLKEVKAAGFDAILVYNNKMYKVQVGAFSIKKNADAYLEKVKKAGFDAFITK